MLAIHHVLANWPTVVRYTQGIVFLVAERHGLASGALTVHQHIIQLCCQ